jgi:hypothetical protein
MKQKIFLRYICIVFSACALLFQACHKDQNSYDVRLAVTDVTQAHLYYYMIFREAENAWALVHKDGYQFGKEITENHRIIQLDSLKKKSYIDVTFTEWKWGTATLSGKLILNLPARADSSYKRKDRITVSLTGFSINGQQMTGFSTISYTGTATTDTTNVVDSYSYALADGSIYSTNGKQILITASVSNGVFRRIDGSATIAQPEDDIWTFNGVMTGLIRNNASQKYSNKADKLLTVFGWDCNNKALLGNCILTIGKQEIFYDYGIFCDSEIDIKTDTPNNK